MFLWNNFTKRQSAVPLDLFLVKGMTDSDLLDIHSFLTEDDDWDGNEPEDSFYINS